VSVTTTLTLMFPAAVIPQPANVFAVYTTQRALTVKYVAQAIMAMQSDKTAKPVFATFLEPTVTLGLVTETLVSALASLM
jgi:hypothetical protein